MSFEREIASSVMKRLENPPVLIQVVTGPRQVGKTTAALQIAAKWQGPVHFTAADALLPKDTAWIESQWEIGRSKAAQGMPCLLILDEVQKIDNWSNMVKLLFDQDRASDTPLLPLLLGSSALLLSKGMTESLAGRFFLHRASHWSYTECHRAFGWDLETWLYFGGYPGAAPLVDDEQSWRAYINDALIEAVLARDVLAMHNIAKPALLRHLFGLASQMPGRIVSYSKMLGQLTDAGNATTLAHYLELMAQAFLVSGLEKYAKGPLKRKTSPKLILWNNALITAPGMTTFDQMRENPALRGRLVENAVGAHLLNHLQGMRFEVGYWRERQSEVDFVVTAPTRTVAIEVKSGKPKASAGHGQFKKRWPESKVLLVGASGMPLLDFFTCHPSELL
ncbi:MAG: AAA family ATPase [Myxococcota bacterium]|nr:AAA family ATPase [Myxococcota bacterium]